MPKSRPHIHLVNRLQSVRLILFLTTAVVLLYGVVYPNLATVKTSLQQNGSWTIQNYAKLLAERATLEAILNSVVLSLGTVILCALIGVSLAFLFERYTFPGRRLFSVLAALPLVLPPLV